MNVTQAEFQIMKEDIVKDMIARLMEERGLTMQQAFDAVYTSRLFEKLGDPDTGLFFQSSGYVYSFLMDELKAKLFEQSGVIKENVDFHVFLRNELVEIALKWQAKFGVSPSITSTVSEYDAAMLVGMSEKEYSEYMKDKTAVNKGSDFVFKNIRYQVKGNRPSGKPGSIVTMVPKATNYEWDRLIWILYDKNYVMQEAWEWNVEEYKSAFDRMKRLSPNDYRKGKCLYKKQ